MISSPTSLSLSLTVALIIASASAKSLAAENCELGASCENEIEDDEDDFGFYWDEEDDGFEYEDDASNLPPCSELTYFEVELGTGEDRGSFMNHDQVIRASSFIFQHAQMRPSSLKFASTTSCPRDSYVKYGSIFGQS